MTDEHTADPHWIPTLWVGANPRPPDCQPGGPYLRGAQCPIGCGDRAAIRDGMGEYHGAAGGVSAVDGSVDAGPHDSNARIPATSWHRHESASREAALSRCSAMSIAVPCTDNQSPQRPLRVEATATWPGSQRRGRLPLAGLQSWDHGHPEDGGGEIPDVLGGTRTKPVASAAAFTKMTPQLLRGTQSRFDRVWEPKVNSLSNQHPSHSLGRTASSVGTGCIK